MAFDYTNLYPDTAANGCLTKSWNYTTLDSVATASAVGYFNKVYNRVGVGDTIFVASVNAFDARTRTSVDSVTLIVTGISGQVVTTEAMSGGSGTPHAPVNSVQFNDAGAFGGNAGFTYDITTGLAVQLTNTGDSGAGATVYIGSGDGGATSGAGGAISILAGSADGSGAGGNVSLFAGSGTGGNAGTVAISSGDVFGAGNGGTIDIIAGITHGAGSAGPVLLEGGTAQNGNAGSASVVGGASNGGNGIGGDVVLSPGHGNGAGRSGYVTVNGGLSSFADDTAAATGGVPVGGLYRTASAVKIRVS